MILGCRRHRRPAAAERIRERMARLPGAARRGARARLGPRAPSSSSSPPRSQRSAFSRPSVSCASSGSVSSASRAASPRPTRTSLPSGWSRRSRCWRSRASPWRCSLVILVPMLGRVAGGSHRRATRRRPGGERPRRHRDHQSRRLDRDRRGSGRSADPPSRSPRRGRHLGLRLRRAHRSDAVHGPLVRRDHGRAPASADVPRPCGAEGAPRDLRGADVHLVGFHGSGDPIRLRALPRDVGEALRATAVGTARIVARLHRVHPGGRHLGARLDFAATLVGGPMNEWLVVGGIAVAAVSGVPGLFIGRQDRRASASRSRCSRSRPWPGEPAPRGPSSRRRTGRAWRSSGPSPAGSFASMSTRFRRCSCSRSSSFRSSAPSTASRTGSSRSTSTTGASYASSTAC